jgi:hypothetical protein
MASAARFRLDDVAGANPPRYKPVTVRLPLRAALLLGAVGCSSSPSGTLQIVLPDGEPDVLTRSPAPTVLEVDSVDSSGTAHSITRASLPAAGIDLGSLDGTTIASLTVTGLDSAGNRLVFGQTLPLEFGALDGITAPVFVQRAGELALMPQPLSDARPAPTLAVLAGRYLLVGGGDDPSSALTTQLYDFAQLAPLAHPPVLPRAPKSIALVGTVAWLIDEEGATAFDFSGQSGPAEVTPPAGGAFADVAGGATVLASDGSQYVVGATRPTGAATATVLAVDPTGKASWKFLTGPRQGAAASWVDGRGLVVVGGSSTAAGVEILGSTSVSGSALAYPPDRSSGAGGASIDSQHVIVAGGILPTGEDAGVRVFDLGCGAQCLPAVWDNLPTPLASAQVFVHPGDPAHALVVGDEQDGTTHAYRVSNGDAEPILPREPHKGARALASPLGSVVLFGGAASIESFVN